MDDVSKNFTVLENQLREENCRLRDVVAEARLQRDNARSESMQILHREMAEVRSRLTAANQTIQRLEESLCDAICIIQNEAGNKTLLTKGYSVQETTLWQWAQELIQESGIDFNAVLDRITREKPDVGP